MVEWAPDMTWDPPSHRAGAGEEDALRRREHPDRPAGSGCRGSAGAGTTRGGPRAGGWAAGRAKRGWQPVLGGRGARIRVEVVLSAATIFLMMAPETESLDDPVTKARLQVGDLLNLRKAMSGESSFPARYRSYDRGDTAFDAALEECCTAAECEECSEGEEIENLQATALTLRRELSLLRGLGCPCDIVSIFPERGGYAGELPVEVTTSGLLLDEAYALGPVECWWRERGDLDVYFKAPAEQISSATVSCARPEKPGPTFLEVTLHGNGWALTSSSEGKHIFEMYDRGFFNITSVKPSGSPTRGGAVVTITGTDFDVNRTMLVRAAGQRFPAQIFNSTTAYCTVPALPVGATIFTLSQDGYNWIEPGVNFGIYKQPTIVLIYPTGGGASNDGEELLMNLGGLGLVFQPEDADLFCRWFTIENNFTYKATRAGLSSTLSCPIPNNTLGQHFMAVPARVEVSLIGLQDDMFTDHGSTGANLFNFSCRNPDILYAGLHDFWPQCTNNKCCPAGYFSDGYNCSKCSEGSYSSVGQTFCFDCPANSLSAAGNPSPSGCICNEGFVGSSQGLIQAPWDTCITCPSSRYPYTAVERVSDRLSRSVHNAAIRALEAGCRTCKTYSRIPEGVLGVTEWDCVCEPGYLCTVGAQTCDEWLAELNLTWSRSTCLASNNSLSPSAVEVAACARSGLSQDIRHGPDGPRTLDCNFASELCPSFFAAQAVNTTCVCLCDHLVGYRNDSSEGEFGRCVDIDECTEGTHTCTGAHVVCVNAHGGDPGYTCECAVGTVWNGTDCLDVDECQYAIDDCHEDAECTNTDGSFTCTCIRGLAGDGLLDCSDGKQTSCTTAFEMQATTAGGDDCWAVDNTTSSWGGGEFYCDYDAGTANEIWFRIFWVEVQGWSDDFLLASGLAVNEQVNLQRFGISWTGSPGLVQYRVSGADAWHPVDVRVRGFGASGWFTPDVPANESLCWVDGNACNELDECFEQDGCGAISPSYTYDFDECSLGLDKCSINAVCSNYFGFYDCSCLAGFYGIGTGITGTGTACLPCAEGTFSPDIGSTACSLCPEGTTGPAGSASGLNCSCRPGTFGTIVAGAAACELCTPGLYCPGGSVVFSCPEGAWSPAGSIIVQDCVCSSGWFGPNGGPCARCPVGFSCEGGREPPVVCEAGNYAPLTSSLCTACGDNSDSGPGSGTCNCFEGFYESSFFSTATSDTCEINGCLPISSMSLCVAAASDLGLGYDFSVPTEEDFALGFQCLVSNGAARPSNESQTCSVANPCVCQSCSPSVCVECSAGSFAAYDSFECLSCPANATSPTGSVDAVDCRCRAGFFGVIVNTSSFCTACPPGSFSPIDGSEECTLCPQGTFGETAGLSACVSCGGLAVTPEGSTSSLDCVCANGTRDDPMGGGCLGIDECLEVLDNCDGFATCTDTDSSFECVCDASYFGADGTVCTSCVAGFECPGGADSLPCPANTYSGEGAAFCEQCRANSTSPPQSTSLADCVCDVGFNATDALSGPCNNLDECALGTNDCDIGAVCADSDGSFSCTCPPGYPGVGTEEFPCLAICGDGLRGSGEFCDDNNTAPGDGCDELCNIEAGWNCSTFFSCGDVEECLLSPCYASAEASASCVELPGSFRCECPPDTYGNGFQCTKCQDFSSSLENTPDQSGCSCVAGYIPFGVGACVNEDECAANTNNCSTYAACNDTVGSYTCGCLPGFDGAESAPDGTFCEERDECAEAIDDCDDFASCADTFGSFECACNAGYKDISNSLGVEAGTTGACAECAPGSYIDGLGAGVCAPCPNGSTTSAGGSASVTDCECIAGYAGVITSSSDTCELCAEGFYSTQNSPACTQCTNGATSLPGSTSDADCFCPVGTYLNLGVCQPCPFQATSPSGSIGDSSCTCVDGWFALSGSGASLVCEECAACDPGFSRQNCLGSDQGTCVEENECALGTDNCDPALAVCQDTFGSFSCFCNESFYGNGTLCTACPDNARSDFGSEDVSDCTCNTGFDVGDPGVVSITSALESCYSSLAMRIVTIDGGETCWTQLTDEYCDVHGGTMEDLWVRVQWADGAWTQWYSLLNQATDALADSGLEVGFNFSLGANVTLFLPQISYIGGLPTRVEYFVAGDDSWRPRSLAVRQKEGSELGGGQWFVTSGQLCWVDAGGQAYSQSALNCSYVGQSATASLHPEGIATPSSVGVGLFRAYKTPHAPNVLRHADLLHVLG